MGNRERTEMRETGLMLPRGVLFCHRRGPSVAIEVFTHSSQLLIDNHPHNAPSNPPNQCFKHRIQVGKFSWRCCKHDEVCLTYQLRPV